MEAPPVTGYELRILADAAWDADQRDLATSLHELARNLEQIERLSGNDDD